MTRPDSEDRAAGRPRASAIARGAWMAALLALAAAGAGAAPERVANGIRFTYVGPNAISVGWAGDFNGWSTSATPMTKAADGTWSVVVPLPAGEHQYKFVVDGQWFADPGNPVTAGEFGNSVVNVGADGALVAMQATSNTEYSPKIFMGGRLIGLYQSIRNDASRRLEINRPNMDIDLNFDTRISRVLRARFLMNINSEAEDVEFFRSRLNFDRGSLRFEQPGLEVLAWDNDDAGTWDDPMHLVGAVGIYDHAYGFDRQGFRVSASRWGVDGELLYADNFAPGGTSFPNLPDPDALVPSIPVEPAGGGYRIVPGLRASSVSAFRSDANEDVVALRLSRSLRPDLRVGLLGRADRGFDLGNALLGETLSDSGFAVRAGIQERQWLAGGAEARWSSPFGLHVAAEYLRGALRMNDVNATRTTYRMTSADSTGVQGFDVVDEQPVRETTTLDDSHRFRVEGAWTASHQDITVRGAFEYQSHGYEVVLDGLDNAMVVTEIGWDRNWRHYLGREVRTTLDVEWTAFDYEAGTPWRYQLWFPTGNFWLEHGEHEVRFDRMVMLGGADAVSVRPRLFVPIAAARNVTFEYEGRFNAVDLGTRPKFAESLFRFGLDVTPALRFGADTRWVKYDDPVLRLHHGYVAHFAELAYRFAPGIQIALSYGVDPWVIDPPVNEYAYIGRDLFLFGLGANGAAAEENYFGLGSFSGLRGAIDAAEHALEVDRRVQIEAIVRF